MNTQQATHSDRYRALKAATIVLALLVSIPGVEALRHALEGPSGVSSVAGQLDSSALVQPDDPYETLERIEVLAGSTDIQVPGAFAQEIGFLPEAEDIRVDDSGSVVGYTVPGSADFVLEHFAEHMGSLGWTAVTLGGAEGATFVKSDGACMWALATCTQVGEVTSVVVRCMYS